MIVFNLREEQHFDPGVRVEKILGATEDGDVTVACWEPGQISPYHCHPHATEIYFCFEGGGWMHALEHMVEIVPGSFVVHPPGELHEYVNGSGRTLLFRVRYGQDMSTRTIAWRGVAGWEPSPLDRQYLQDHPDVATHLASTEDRRLP